MKTCPQIAKILGWTTQSLHYHLMKKDGPMPQLRIKKRKEVRYYDEAEVMEFLATDCVVYKS